mmetsp:Transcript_109067/g.314155  ORF Transcript_109067/g.314155 Transcript_109067/m.314155 type:complete len:202 (+) Transcript_109067:1812-2417(+)
MLPRWSRPWKVSYNSRGSLDSRIPALCKLATVRWSNRTFGGDEVYSSGGCTTPSFRTTSFRTRRAVLCRNKYADCAFSSCRLMQRYISSSSMELKTARSKPRRGRVSYRSWMSATRALRKVTMSGTWIGASPPMSELLMLCKAFSARRKCFIGVMAVSHVIAFFISRRNLPKLSDWAALQSISNAACLARPVSIEGAGCPS